MDLAADSTNSDIPTTLTEEEARQLEKELGGATDGAFDKADDVASASTEKKVGRIGKELDGAVDGAFDDAAEQTGKKVKKVWMTFKGRAKDVKNGAVKAWQSVTEVRSPMHSRIQVARYVADKYISKGMGRNVQALQIGMGACLELGQKALGLDDRQNRRQQRVRQGRAVLRHIPQEVHAEQGVESDFAQRAVQVL
jgi:hypothetical protein